LSFPKDLDWIATLLVNLERSVGAGVIWALVFLVFGVRAEFGALQLLLLFPIAYFFGFVPLGIVGDWLSERGVPWAGLISGIASLAILVGDPLVYAVSRAAPHLVPVADFKVFNRVMLLFVVKSPDARTEPDRFDLKA
jgi:hypothetical protein